METLKFKTNMKCSGCVAKVTPALDELAGKGNWDVDLSSTEKTLKVNGADAVRIRKSVQKAGFQIEQV
jgi:copper chaperone